MARTFSATSGAGLTTARGGPPGTCAGRGAPISKGTCTAFFALPQAANTDAIAGGNGGSFLLDASPSTIAIPVRERLRPFTHQLSPTRIPGSMIPTPPVNPQPP